MTIAGKFLTACTAAAALFGALAVTPASAQTAQRVTAPVTALGRPAGAPAHIQSLLETTLAKARADSAPRVAASHLNLPYGIALDKEGNLYVANVLGNNVAVYNAKRQFLGPITGNMSFPVAVSVNDENNIVVLNNASSTINYYSMSGTQLASITDPALQNGVMVAVDADDSVWALDAYGILHGYLADGTILPDATTGGTTVGLWGPNVGVWGVPDVNGGYDEVFGNRALAVHNNTQLSAIFPGISPQAGAQATDGGNLEYITDAANHQVDIWSASGIYASPVGTFTVPSEPIGIAVDALRKRIYVAFPFLNEVIVYSTVAPYSQLAVIH